MNSGKPDCTAELIEPRGAVSIASQERKTPRVMGVGHVALSAQRSPNVLLIPGTSSVQHLRENLQAAALTLPANTLAKLNSICAKSEQKAKEEI